MSATTISSHALKNGLTMTILDESRKIAADRWYVCVRVNIAVPVEKKWFAADAMDDTRFEQIAGVLGDQVIFSQKRERNFISEGIKDKVIKDICDSALKVGKAYCSSDRFAAGYILKAYGAQQRRY